MTMYMLTELEADHLYTVISEQVTEKTSETEEALEILEKLRNYDSEAVVRVLDQLNEE